MLKINSEYRLSAHSWIGGEGVVRREGRVVGRRQLGGDERASDAVKRRFVPGALQVLPQRS